MPQLIAGEWRHRLHGSCSVLAWLVFTCSKIIHQIDLKFPWSDSNEIKSYSIFSRYCSIYDDDDDCSFPVALWNRHYINFYYISSRVFLMVFFCILVCMLPSVTIWIFIFSLFDILLCCNLLLCLYSYILKLIFSVLLFLILFSPLIFHRRPIYARYTSNSKLHSTRPNSRL